MSWNGDSKTINAVGLIGCGNMGRKMAERLVSAGYKLYVYDSFPAFLEFVHNIGAETVSSTGDLAQRCNVIIMSLPGPAQVEDAIFSLDGMHKNLGSDHVIVDTSTVDPGTTRKMSEQVSEKGSAYLDAPILGRPSAAGKWMLPVGGEEKVLDYVKPVLLTFAANAVLVGPQGAGNALKLLNQLMFSAINAVSSEVLAISTRVGIGKEVFYRIVAESSAATVSGLFKEVGKTIVNNSFEEPNFTVDLLLKDAKLALQMAKDAGAPSVVAGNVQRYNEIASQSGLGSLDSSALYKVFCQNFSQEIKL